MSAQWTPPEHHHAVTPTGKIYWSVRNALGEFCRLDGTNGSTRAWTLAAWREYLSARYASAEHATRGHMTNAIGRRLGVRESNLLRPSASLRCASRELVDWLTEHGPTLSWRAFARQMVETEE